MTIGTRGRFGQRCDRCHGADAWGDRAPFQVHRSARLPLSGMHALIECRACHVRTGSDFTDAPPSRCDACHRGDYDLHTNHPRHTFDPQAPTRPAFPTDCRLCHNTLAWSPARLPVQSERGLGVGASALSRRAHTAAFPIVTGAHGQLACGDCHRTPSGGPVSCVGCHAHAEPALQRQHRRRPLPAGRAAAVCLSCHVRGARR